MTPLDRMRLSEAVKMAEGFSPTAYQDSMGVWTVGYGCNLQELTVTEAWAETKLTEKLQESEEAAMCFEWYHRLSGVQQQAIVELLFNLGLPRFRGFVEMLAALVQAKYDVAADELLDSRWASQVGVNRSQRLARMLRDG